MLIMRILLFSWTGQHWTDCRAANEYLKDEFIAHRICNLYQTITFGFIPPSDLLYGLLFQISWKSWNLLSTLWRMGRSLQFQLTLCMVWRVWPRTRRLSRKCMTSKAEMDRNLWPFALATYKRFTSKGSLRADACLYCSSSVLAVSFLISRCTNHISVMCCPI